MMVAGLRPMTKAMEKPPEPKVRAPVLDPTCGNQRRVTSSDDPVGSAYHENEITAATLQALGIFLIPWNSGGV